VRPEHSRDHREHPVPRDVAVGVVDLLEPVEVHHDHGHGAVVPAGALQLDGQLLVERPVVVQERQGVLLRKGLDEAEELRVLHRDRQVGRQDAHRGEKLRLERVRVPVMEHEHADALPLGLQGDAKQRPDVPAQPPEVPRLGRFPDVGDPGRLSGKEDLPRDPLSRGKLGRRPFLRVAARVRLRDELLRLLVEEHDAEIVQVEPSHHAFGYDPVELLRVQGAGDGGRDLCDRPKVLDAGLEARLDLLAGAYRLAQRRDGPFQPAGDRLRERDQRAFDVLEGIPFPGDNLLAQPLHGADHVPLQQKVAAQGKDRLPGGRAGEERAVAAAAHQHGDQEGERENPSPENGKYQAPTLHDGKGTTIFRRVNPKKSRGQKTIPTVKLTSPGDSPGRRSSFHP